MRNVANYQALADLPAASEQQRKALVEAIDLDLAVPGLYLDLLNGKALNDGNVTLLSGRKTEAPKLERIKSFMGMKYATPSDSPFMSDVPPRVEAVFHDDMANIDLGWTNLFSFIDMRGSNQDSFDLLTGSFGISFKQRAPGEKTEIWRLPSEDSVNVKYVTYSAGAGVLDDWLRYGKWWNVAEIIAEFRAKAWDHQASSHYGLFTALSAAIDIAFSVDDTQTFNTAAGSIFRALENKGYGVSANTPLWIVTNPEKKGRVLRMLEATQGSLIVGYNQNLQPITATVAGVISTTKVAAAADHYYLVLPGHKLKRATWMDLSIEKNRDIFKRAEDMVGTFQSNAVIGDTDQVRRVKFA